MITGDISHTGTERSYRLAKCYLEQLRKLGGPVIPLMGNADNRPSFRKVLLDDPNRPEDAPCCSSQTIESIRVIVMDSHTPGASAGSFSDDQLHWLAAELSDHHDTPTIIGCHLEN